MNHREVLAKGMYRVRAQAVKAERRPYRIVPTGFKAFAVFAGPLPTSDRDITPLPDFIGFFPTEQQAEAEIQRRIREAEVLAKPPKPKYKLATDEDG